MVQPPYSPHISDYTSQPGKIMATLVNTSPNGGSIQVYLLGSITSSGGINIYTDPAYKMPEPVTVYAGQPYMISQNNIEQVFSESHLIFNGITKQQVINGNGLPEDDYQICIRAYDYNTGQPVSGEDPMGCANLSISSVEPPIVLNPICGDSITILPPQSMIMNWTMPVGTPVNTQYYLKMVEILPGERDPNDAMHSAGHPVFFETTLPTTSYIYGPANPALVEGKRYAFAVTAIDPTGKTAYRNGGMSEVCSFTCKVNSQGPGNGNTTTLQTTVRENTMSTGCTSTCKHQLTENTSPGTVNVNDDLQIAGFSMKVTSLDNPPAGDGSFSGIGKVPLPVLNSQNLYVKVHFDKIKVNGSKEVYDGKASGILKNNADFIPQVDNGLPVLPDDFSPTGLLNYFTDPGNNGQMAISNPTAEYELPIGKENGNYTLAITGVNFTAEQATFNAALAMNVSGKTIAFGAQHICFSPGGMCKSGILFLAKDVPVPAGSTDMITLKSAKSGFMNTISDPGTYVSFDANGFEELNLDAEYSTSHIKNVSDNKPAAIELKATAKDWSDWIANISVEPFYIDGQKDFSFDLDKSVPAYYDHSINSNPVGVSPVLAKLEEPGGPEWQGFYMPQLLVSLPAFVKRLNDPKPVTASLNDLIIDGQGVSVDAGLKNVLALGDGSLASWYFSVDALDLSVRKNSFNNASMTGKVILPVSGNDQGLKNQLDYTCLLAYSGEKLKYNFSVKAKDGISAPLWAAYLNIFSSSQFTINNDNPSGNIVADILLNGDLTIKTPDVDPIGSLDFELMHFEGLELSSIEPYFTLKYMSLGSPQKSMGGDGLPMGPSNEISRGLAGFPVTLKYNGLSTEGVGFKFGVDLKISDNALLPKVEGDFDIYGSLEYKTGNRPQIGGPKISTDAFIIEGPLGPVFIDGKLAFINTREWGHALSGSVGTSLLGVKLGGISGLGTEVVFGHKTEPDDFYYFAVNFHGTFAPVAFAPPSNLAWNGFGGGMYYHMSMNDKDVNIADPDAVLMKINGGQDLTKRYKPDKNSLVGFLATVMLGTVDKTMMNSASTLDIGINKNFSLDHVQYDLNGVLLSPPLSLGKLSFKNSLATISGRLKLDLSQNIYTADMDAQYIAKVIGNEVETPMSGDGKLNILADLNKGLWHIYAGTPRNPNYLHYKPYYPIPFDLDFKGYFMAGNDLGSDLPEFPSGFQGIMDQCHITVKPNPDRNNLAGDGNGGGTTGMTCGGYVDLGNPGGYDFEFIKVKFYGITGFDVSLFHSDKGCDGQPGKVGINGWYANGKIYGGLNLGVMAHVNLFGEKMDATIFDATAGAELSAGLPNPFWFDGDFFIHYDVLEGYVSGSINVPLKYGGDKCSPNAGDPLGGMNIISDLIPANSPASTGKLPKSQAGKVSIAATPAAAFNFPVEKNFEINYKDKENNDKHESFRINITEFYIRDLDHDSIFCGIHKSPSIGRTAFNNNKEFHFYSSDLPMFNPQTNYMMYLKVTVFDAQNKPLKNNATHKDYTEEKTVYFKTGDCLNNLAEIFLGGYPVPGERHFLTKQTPNGYFQLKQDAPCLVEDAKYDLKVRFTHESGSTDVPVIHSGSSSRFVFQVPDLPNDKVVKISIVKILNSYGKYERGKAASGFSHQALLSVYKSSYASVNLSTTRFNTGENINANLPDEIELYHYYFKTSQFKTLPEKLLSMENADQVTADRNGFNTARFGGRENFDVFDVNGYTKSIDAAALSIHPLVSITENTGNNSYQRDFILPLYYAMYNAGNCLSPDKTFYHSGVPDNKAVRQNSIPFIPEWVFPDELTADQPLGYNEIPPSLRYSRTTGDPNEIKPANPVPAKNSTKKANTGGYNRH
ncbi:MAG: hypothetical protein HXX13_09305 [Bacteroidetes bacterium]|nr:hypothetical protein [Bacteroidota bacterium]